MPVSFTKEFALESSACLCATVALAAHHPGLTSLVSVWTAHIRLARMLGYGLKYSPAFVRTHLGTLGIRPVWPPVHPTIAGSSAALNPGIQSRHEY
jgi:hypothetical protein